MSKARQSKRQRYRKPRADYQAGGRVLLNGGGESLGRMGRRRGRFPPGSQESDDNKKGRENVKDPTTENDTKSTDQPPVETNLETGRPTQPIKTQPKSPTTKNPISGITNVGQRKQRVTDDYDKAITDAVAGKVSTDSKIADITSTGDAPTKLEYKSAKDITSKDPVTIAAPSEDDIPTGQVINTVGDETVSTVADEDIAQADDVTLNEDGTVKSAAQINIEDDLKTVTEDATVNAATATDLSDESTITVDDVAVTGVDDITAAKVADEFKLDDPEANAALVKRVTGTLSPEAKADAVKVAGLSERKITRYKKQLRNAGLTEDEIKEIGNDPEALEDRVLDFTESERGVIEGLPEEALVSTQIEGLLEGMEEGNPPAWARPAIAAVNQMLAERGMSASTVGRDALFNAVIQSAMPIAQSNAQAIQASVAQSKDIEAKEAAQNAQMAQETAMQNASVTFQMDMANFSAEQQAAVTNAKYFQTVALTETNNRQQAVIQDAVITSQLNIAEADMQTKARINNANAFLKLDMTNLANKQQANVLEAQIENQRMLSNQAAVNTALALNTTEQNKVDMFMTNVQKEIELTNAASVNSMAQFNANSKNAAEARDKNREADRRKANASMAQDIDKFNSEMEFRRKSWNSANAAAVAAADVAYHRKTNEINTATQNAINMQNAMNSFKMSSQGLAFLNQEMRDQADFEFKSYEASEQRVASLIVGALGADKHAYENQNWRSALITQVTALTGLIT